MTVYFKKEITNNIAKYLNQEEIPAHQKIAAVYANAIKDSVQPSNLLQELGVFPSDTSAIQEMSHLLKTLEDESLQIVQTPNTGVFFIQKKYEPIDTNKTPIENVAIFKIGRKRAAMETAARYLAHHLGLEKQMIPGMFCALLDPPLFNKSEFENEDDDETVEDLWNGLEKVYLPSQESAHLISAKIKEPLKRLSHFESAFDKSPLSAMTFNNSEEESSSTDKKTPPSSPKKLQASPKSQKNNSDSTKSTSYITSSKRSTSPLKNILRQIEMPHSDDEEYPIAEPEITASAVVGLVQPFLSDRKEATLYEFTLMTLFALAIGLRDGKKDGYKGSEWFDVEDAFPIRIDPTWTPEKIKKSPSALDLPYLDKDPRTLASLSPEQVSNLAAIVENWNIDKIIESLKSLKIRYRDTSAEKLPKRTKGKDEGGCRINIKSPDPHLINGHLNHLSSANDGYRIFLPSQLDACRTRLQRLKEYILKCSAQKQTFTPQDLVHCVDPWGKIYQQTILSSPKLNKFIDSRLAKEGIYHLIGQLSPDSSKVNVPSKDYSEYYSSKPPVQRSLFAKFEESGKPEEINPIVKYVQGESL